MKSALSSLMGVGVLLAAAVSTSNAAMTDYSAMAAVGGASEFSVNRYDGSSGAVSGLFLQSTPEISVPHVQGQAEPSHSTLPASIASQFGAGYLSNVRSRNPGANAGTTFHIEYEYNTVPETPMYGVLTGMGCLLAMALKRRA